MLGEPGGRLASPAPAPMIVAMLRGALLICVCLTACAGTSAPPESFVRAVGLAGRVRIAREGGRVVEQAVVTTRAAVPRPAAVTIAAVQPGGDGPTLEQVFRGGSVLFRATTKYAEAGIGTRTVLVDGRGEVIERSHELMPSAVASPEFSSARAAVEHELGGSAARYEIVHGDGEWLRAHASDAGRVVDCDLDGTLRSVQVIEVRATPGS